MNRKHNAIVISDNKKGHVNQSKALCQLMGWNASLLPVNFKFPSARLLSIGLNQIGITSGVFVNGLDYPDHLFENSCAIIGTGSHTYYSVKFLSNKFHIPSIAILNPGVFARGFDLAIIPEYENNFPESIRVLKTPCNLSFQDETGRADSIATLHERTSSPHLKSWSIIIGGDNKTSFIDPKKLEIQITQILKLIPSDTVLYATSSRRSGPEIEAVLKSFSSEMKLLVLASADDYNPIPAFTHLCERIFVTSDSASMMSEIVTDGNAFIEVLLNEQKISQNKFLRFIENLKLRECIHVFDGNLGYAQSKLDLNYLKDDIQDALSLTELE